MIENLIIIKNLNMYKIGKKIIKKIIRNIFLFLKHVIELLSG